MIRQCVVPWFLLFLTLFGNAQTDQLSRALDKVPACLAHGSP